MPRVDSWRADKRRTAPGCAACAPLCHPGRMPAAAPPARYARSIAQTRGQRPAPPPSTAVPGGRCYTIRGFRTRKAFHPLAWAAGACTVWARNCPAGRAVIPIRRRPSYRHPSAVARSSATAPRSRYTLDCSGGAFSCASCAWIFSDPPGYCPQERSGEVAPPPYSGEAAPVDAAQRKTPPSTSAETAAAHRWARRPEQLRFQLFPQSVITVTSSRSRIAHKKENVQS